MEEDLPKCEEIKILTGRDEIEKAHELGKREFAELMFAKDTSEAIHTAVRLGYPNLVVDNFPKFKAEIDILALVSSNTLHEAARAGYCEIVSLLIKFFQEKEPENLEKHINFGEDSKFRKALHWAIRIGDTDVVEAIVASNVNSHRDMDFTTPLHLSIKPWVTDENLQRVIPKSERRSRAVLVKFLLQSTKGREMLNLKDWQGNTPLHLAVETRNVSVVELLIKQSQLIATERNCQTKTPSRLVWDQAQSDSTKNDPDVKIIRNYLRKLRDVEEEIKSMRDARSRYYNVASNLLVGGALLATVTFSGILSMVVLPPEFLTKECTVNTLALSPADLQPPSPSIALEQSPPLDTQIRSTKEMDLKGYYVRAVDIFRGSNNLSFFFSIITMMSAIRLIISRGENVPLESEISQLRHSTILISLSLTFSTIFAVVAFISGGLGKVPVAESGWGYVLSQWTRGHAEAILKSTMLTTTMVGLILIVPFILSPFLKDHLDLLRAYLETKMIYWDTNHAKYAIGSWRPFVTLVLAILFIVATIFIMFLLIFGIGNWASQRLRQTTSV